MNKGLSVRVFFAALLAAGVFLPAADQTPLPERHKKWLQEDVAYLITPTEKQVFLQLESDRKRDLFVDAFWKQRDPIPLTDHNEFKDEHYRRIEYTNKQFGRLSSLPGWKTDRGRIYISIGPPLTINRYEGFSSIYPVEVWNYQGMAEYGLPNMFRIVFYRKFGSGDYVLYSPSMDGPRSLIGSSLDISVDAETAAYNEIYGNDPILAECSRSLIPGEIVIRGTPSLESESLLLALHSAPHKRVRDEYAKKLLLYDTQIDVEYTANYVGNNSQVKIVRDDSGLFFVNYLIEFEKFSMEEHEGVYLTQLLVNGSVTDDQKRVIFQFDRPVPVKLDREQIEKVRQQRFCLQDLFPLTSGDYWLKILVKNEASKEFTSIETPIHVPDGKDLQISPLILAYKKEQDSSGKMKAFKTEGFQLFSSPRNDFSNADTLILFLQLTGDRPPVMTGGSLRITVFKGGEEFRKVDRAIKPGRDASNGWEEFPLAGFPADYYRMRVALVTAEGKEVCFSEENFYVSHIPFLPRPWTYSTVHNPSGSPVYLSMVGDQLIKKGELEQGCAYLEKIYSANPDSAQAAISYGRALFSLRQFRVAETILTPFYQKGAKEVLELLARAAHAAGNYAGAIQYYNDYISTFGANFYILAFLGECHFGLGEKEEALAAWEKSLEMNPNQDDLAKRVKDLKK